MSTPLRIRGVMLDWAGTTVDHGSVAPVLALQELFARHNLALSSANARRHMGLLKRDHIRAILSLPDVQADWRALAGRDPGEEDVLSLFAEFGPLQLEIIARHSKLIDGVMDTIHHWQSRGIRIGTSTGYTREMLAPVEAQAAAAGYRPDASVCPDEVQAGRPAPWMLMRNAQLLDLYPPAACVKIGDTVVGIEEGKNAGMWTIGLTKTGNLIGLDREQWEQLPADEQRAQLRKAEEILLAAGADFVAEDLPSCDAILHEIEARANAANGLSHALATPTGS